MDKVLVLTTSYPKYAGDINGGFVHELSKRLTKDFEVFLLAPRDRESKKQEEIDDVKIFRYPQFFWNVNLAYGDGVFENLKSNPLYLFVLPVFIFFQFLWIRKLCRTHKIKKIHAHWIIPNALVAVLFKYFNKDVKVLATIHGSDFWAFDNSLGKKLVRFILKRIDSLTVVNNAIKQKILLLNADKKEVSVIPMGVNTELFSPDIFISARAKTNKTILFVGILTEMKGVNILIEAMPQIIKNYPDIKLKIIGDGILKETLIKRAKELKSEKNIEFLGSIKHSLLPDYFSSSDIFVLPSLSEGWPVVVMEALASGKICVVTDIPSFYGIEKDFLIKTKVGDTDDLAKKIMIGLEKAGDKELAIKTREYAVSNFDWKVIANQYKVQIQKL